MSGGGGGGTRHVLTRSVGCGEGGACDLNKSQVVAMDRWYCRCYYGAVSSGLI